MTTSPSADQLKASGLEQFRAGRPVEAAAAFREAARAFAAAGDHLAAAEMANNLSVSLIARKDFGAALAAVEDTPAIFQRAGDPLRQAQSLGNQAAALEGLGRMEEATELYQQAADLFERAGDQEQRTATLRALAAVQLKRGHSFDALTSLQAGLDDEPHPTLTQRATRRLLKLPFKLLGR